MCDAGSVHAGIAQILDRGGKVLALVGGNPFEHADPGLEPFIVRGILGGLFGGVVGQQFQLALLEAQAPLLGFGHDRGDGDDADDQRAHGEDVSDTH